MLRYTTMAVPRGQEHDIAFQGTAKTQIVCAKCIQHQQRSDCHEENSQVITVWIFITPRNEEAEWVVRELSVLPISIKQT